MHPEVVKAKEYVDSLPVKNALDAKIKHLLDTLIISRIAQNEEDDNFEHFTEGLQTLNWFWRNGISPDNLIVDSMSIFSGSFWEGRTDDVRKK